jgi:hypothetical protein
MMLCFRQNAPRIKRLHKRSLYGNMFGYGGKEIEDVKVHLVDGEFDENSDFLSTADETFEKSNIGKFIRNKFLEKSEYEK